MYIDQKHLLLVAMIRPKQLDYDHIHANLKSLTFEKNVHAYVYCILLNCCIFIPIYIRLNAKHVLVPYTSMFRQVTTIAKLLTSQHLPVWSWPAVSTSLRNNSHAQSVLLSYSKSYPILNPIPRYTIITFALCYR